MIHLYVAFIDGTFVEETFPNHTIEIVEEMIEATPKELLVRVEIENNRETLTYQYKRKSDYVY